MEYHPTDTIADPSASAATITPNHLHAIVMIADGAGRVDPKVGSIHLLFVLQPSSLILHPSNAIRAYILARLLALNLDWAKKESPERTKSI